MSENNVIISIKGTQSYEQQEDDVIELVTEGRLEREDEGHFTLSYQESEVTGLEGTLTTFQIEPERITLMRLGGVNSEMVFELGRRHLSMYDTPYGALAMGVNTRELSAALDEQGGQIRIVYDIELDHALAGRNTFDIQIRQARR
ncbi:DUF1934 domain-containing protein [Pseudoflavonifractor sp. DSM 107456]|uniref:DUF1934 domain-containing protein n=2 Tax=Pseudoflavonifractor TaxID=1017280 RepID=A0ABR9R985_9FIRM|nr:MULTISPECIES: DUF1934 domain-containing protein [Eubacteriales]MBS5134633.1 DUF1934 domain-containing protein [Oscillospiraceae bacterium]MBS6215564.1 DUF1934 domain-containing protein [Clostridiales bacterium]MBC5729594.1 DUF1934 domain-containing protein [Pseudoflavonifractor hominis]MBE5054940.1 DUF1934 domain-containing protein [Pseudoflavonifractor gallinarum]MBT9685096.1 DUF1934 family protein [Pseudoflavonifractor sp. MCC625]